MSRLIKPGDTVYFEDESTDFFPSDKPPRQIDGNYRYVSKNPFGILGSLLLYRLVFLPIGYFHSKVSLSEKIIGKEKLRAVRGGYFIIGNHTHKTLDAFSPSLISFPRRAFVVVDPKNLDIPVLGGLLPGLGAIPLPTSHTGVRGYFSAIERRISEGAAVTIYPEAHLWPYYSGIRDFSAEALTPIIRTGAPAFSATRVYSYDGGRLRASVYIDGPFYPDQSLPRREAKAKLRDELISAMRSRSESSAAEPVKYIKKKV